MWLTIGRTARLFVPSRVERDRLVILYSGNLGLAHEADTLSEAMERLRRMRGFSLCSPVVALAPASEARWGDGSFFR